MNLDGLLVVPEFSNIEKYLKSGIMTKPSDEIINISKFLDNNEISDGRKIRELLVLMNKKTKRLNNFSDNRKFKRIAHEILLSGERTGCCDSSTLFISLARAQKIPSMQIITLDKEEGINYDKNGDYIHSGHFFSACYVKDVQGKYSWVIIDSDRTCLNIEDVRFKSLDMNDRNINEKYYAFAYANDFRDIDIDGLKIDSISNMCKIQTLAYSKLDKSFIRYSNELER